MLQFKREETFSLVEKRICQKICKQENATFFRCKWIEFSSTMNWLICNGKAFTKFGLDNAEEHNEEVRQATRYLIEVCIPQ